MPGHLSALPSRLPLEIIHIRDAPEVDILVEISVKGEVQGKVPLGTRVVEPSVTTRESGAGTEVLAARVVEPSVTTREPVAGAEVRINQEEDQREKIGARTILDEEGIRVRVEGAGDVRLTPQHSSSALFCVFCGEECRDDLAGCHRS
jgi:hypothetical protein